MKITYFDFQETLQPEDITSVAYFLHKELEQYGDPSEDIAKAIRYALDRSPDKGGLVAVMSEEGQTVGAAVINPTGMEDYIPENILVYIAISRDRRGFSL